MIKTGWSIKPKKSKHTLFVWITSLACLRKSVRNALMAASFTFHIEYIYRYSRPYSTFSNCFALFFIKGHFFIGVRARSEMGSLSKNITLPEGFISLRFYSTHSRSIPDFASYPRVTSNWPDSCSLYPMSWVHLHHRRRLQSFHSSSWWFCFRTSYNFEPSRRNSLPPLITLSGSLSI